MGPLSALNAKIESALEVDKRRIERIRQIPAVQGIEIGLANGADRVVASAFRGVARVEAERQRAVLQLRGNPIVGVMFKNARVLNAEEKRILRAQTDANRGLNKLNKGGVKSLFVKYGITPIQANTSEEDIGALSSRLTDLQKAGQIQPNEFTLLQNYLQNAENVWQGAQNANAQLNATYDESKYLGGSLSQAANQQVRAAEQRIAEREAKAEATRKQSLAQAVQTAAAVQPSVDSPRVDAPQAERPVEAQATTRPEQARETNSSKGYNTPMPFTRPEQARETTDSRVGKIISFVEVAPNLTSDQIAQAFRLGLTPGELKKLSSLSEEAFAKVLEVLELTEAA